MIKDLSLRAFLTVVIANMANRTRVIPPKIRLGR
jgi:hypothetical protein